jgi:hypothetical protein
MDTERTEDDVYGNKTPAQWQKYWIKEIEAFKKRVRRFHKAGDETVKRYLDEEGRTKSSDNGRYGNYALNLFHSNIQTVQSMLYGSTPKIEVGREHNDPDDDIARVAGLMYQRILQADIDPSGEDLPTVLKACLQDRLLPGLGVARVRYEMHTRDEPMTDPATGQPVMGEDGEPMTVQVLDYEEAPIDYVHWNDFLWSFARTWQEMHWMGFRNYLDKDQATARFGEEIASKLTYKPQTPDLDDDKASASPDDKSVVEKAAIIEIWCKPDRKVFWVQEGQAEILDCKDDPLELDGFWPVPKVMIANQTTRQMIPVPDFVMAQDIYNQIDELYTRITIITRAIKVVGVYDEAAGSSVGRMLQEGTENDLIPVENWAMFSEGGGLRGKIDWFPVQDVVATLQTLQGSLGQQMELLYQVTGMADIMRGQSEQYSGVGQEQLKAKFASIRVQSLQDDFARFASDLETLRAEVISKHFEPASILQQSGAAFLPKPDLRMVPAALQLMKSPEIKWRVNIRPESIAMVDYAQIKAERTEYIMAISQYIQSAQAMASTVPGSLPVLLEMMKWGVAGFKGANYLEGILDQAIQMALKAQEQGGGQDEGPSPEQIKLQTEQMRQQTAQIKMQGDLQKIQAKSQADMASLQAKIQGEIAKITADSSADLTLENTTANNRMVELMRELDNELKIIRANMNSDLAVEAAQAQYDTMSDEANHIMELERIRAQNRRQLN